MLMARPCKPLVSSNDLYSCSLIQGGRRFRGGRAGLLVPELALATLPLPLSAFENAPSSAFVASNGGEFVTLWAAAAAELVTPSADLGEPASSKRGGGPGGRSPGGGVGLGGKTIVRELVS